MKNEELVYFQKAPYPTQLADLVKNTRYRPGWTVRLANIDRGQGSEGTTLIIQTVGYDSYNPELGQNYRVNHYMPVPPAAYDLRSWRRWLHDQLLLVEIHECGEFLKIGNKRPYAPHHGPGNDPYIVFDHGNDVDTRTMYTGEVLKAKDAAPPAGALVTSALKGGDSSSVAFAKEPEMSLCETWAEELVRLQADSPPDYYDTPPDTSKCQAAINNPVANAAVACWYPSCNCMKR